MSLSLASPPPNDLEDQPDQEKKTNLGDMNFETQVNHQGKYVWIGLFLKYY
jgi:hypothetical protein